MRNGPPGDREIVALSSATHTVRYDPTKLSFVGASVFSGWGITAGADLGTITIMMSDATGRTAGGSIEILQLANITFNVLETFVRGVSNLNIAPINPKERGLFWSNNNVEKAPSSSRCLATTIRTAALIPLTKSFEETRSANQSRRTPVPMAMTTA